jgi:hypothetical protein
MDCRNEEHSDGMSSHGLALERAETHPFYQYMQFLEKSNSEKLPTERILAAKLILLFSDYCGRCAKDYKTAGDHIAFEFWRRFQLESQMIFSRLIEEIES